ncbi:MAG: PorP/SprF family type IX secretion system membrane protein [Bacteroidia bacterium]|nr:PorP/SprF family type IX secretion system membrane protein [Bacteroidia bacterium]
MKISIASLLIFATLVLPAQQMPYFTQVRTNAVFFNPAVLGTKRLIDLRFNYRNQWVGFDGQPKTQGFNLNSRLYKGKMGAGIQYWTDITGPTERDLFSVGYAYHFRYPDIEMSLGVSANFYKYFINGAAITIRNSQDKTIDRSILADDRFFDMNAGFLLYNDRFHVGLCAQNLIQQSAEFYDGVPDSVKGAIIKMVPHPFFTVGYNWAGHPDFVWENTFNAGYITGATITMDYSLRIFIRNKMIGGASYRLKDAVALHAGFILLDQCQIVYSYDIGMSALRKAHQNTHEISLVWSSDLEFIFGKRRGNNAFAREKFQYMF